MISTRWQFVAADTDSCSNLISGTPDVYNNVYRTDCQLALNTATLPHSIANAYVDDCFTLTNNTVKYRATVCCQGRYMRSGARTAYIVKCTAYSLQCTVYSVQCTLYTVYSVRILICSV